MKNHVVTCHDVHLMRGVLHTVIIVLVSRAMILCSSPQFAFCVPVSRICMVWHGVIDNCLLLAQLLTGVEIKINLVTWALILCA